MTRFGIVWPTRSTLRFDASGRPLPAGQTVTNPGSVGSVAVTFNTTATAPDVGTPPVPATCTSIDAPSVSVEPPCPDRVSRIRAGVNGKNVAAPVGAAPEDGCQGVGAITPTTSPIAAMTPRTN